MQLIVLIIYIYFLLESMLLSPRKVEKSIKMFTKYRKVYIIFLTFSQEIGVTGIVTIIAIDLL